MSVSITITWKVADYPDLEYTLRVGDRPDEVVTDEQAESVTHPDQLLELGSSVIYPGLSMRVA